MDYDAYWKFISSKDISQSFTFTAFTGKNYKELKESFLNAFPNSVYKDGSYVSGEGGGCEYVVGKTTVGLFHHYM